MKPITFKEYLASKDQLIQAMSESPVRTGKYIVKKYCKLRVGDDKYLKEYVTLKPKQILFIEWNYKSDNLESPEPTSIKVESSSETLSSYQPGDRLLKWLDCNTNETTLL